jgi:preprotein translocase SecE subunit
MIIVLINKKTIKFIEYSYLEINKFFWPNFQKVLNLTFNVLFLLFIIIIILGILDIFFLNLTNFFYKDISL